MTKYTASDFANARFAEHPDGRIAVRFNIYPDFPWTFNRGSVTDEYRDVGMAHAGWVPVPTKPTITRKTYDEAIEFLGGTRGGYGFDYALRLLGGEVIPDPEPTNADKLTRLINSAQLTGMDARNIAEYLDGYGIRVKGN